MKLPLKSEGTYTFSDKQKPEETPPSHKGRQTGSVLRTGCVWERPRTHGWPEPDQVMTT